MLVRRSRSDYLTPGSLEAKTQRWLSAVRPYLRARRVEEFPFRPAGSALLLIDAQRYFFDPDSPAFLPAAPTILPRIRDLEAVFHREGRPVFFTRQAVPRGRDSGLMERWWKHSLYEGDPLAEIVAPLRSERSQGVIAKTTYSAFAGTDLERRLRAAGIERVVVAGVLTHLCCETTARDAFERNFEVFFVADATASRSEDLHLAALKSLADGFARIMTAGEIIACLD